MNLSHFLLSVSLPPFSCSPCLEYLRPCALIHLDLGDIFTYLLTYLFHEYAQCSRGPRGLPWHSWIRHREYDLSLIYDEPLSLSSRLSLTSSSSLSSTPLLLHLCSTPDSKLTFSINPSHHSHPHLFGRISQILWPFPGLLAHLFLFCFALFIFFVWFVWIW